MGELILAEGSAPSTPASGFGSIYVSTAGRARLIEDAGSDQLIALSKVVRKTAETQAVNASTTLVNDDALVFAIPANETWAGKLILFVSTNVAAGIKVALDVPTSATLRMGAIHYIATAVSAVATTTTDAAALGATALITRVDIEFLVVNSSNAGNVQLMWAQNASDASDTKVLTNSFLRAEKL